uniref:Uncharacterized protein n=2 Tax=Oreochromis TaxID=8139 RepID=A0A669BS02_ORENI
MSPTVLLLLSLLTAPCGGCEFDLEGVKNIKGTIDSSSAGFVSETLFTFPNFGVVVLLRFSSQCCVFPAAYVLLDSWQVLLTNLWEEHLNHSLVVELTRTLDKITSTNRNMETDLSQFSLVSSSPEELLKLTSELFSRWIQIGCPPTIETCTLPNLPPSVERKDYSPSRARLLTTRAVDNMKSGRIIDTPPLSSGVPPSYSAFVWSSLLLRLYWCLLP